jgi:uncharacterized protein YkwD
MSRIGIVAVLALVTAGSLSRPQRALAQQPDSEVVTTYVRELHDLVNRYRASAGCLPLAWHEEAARVAESHSADMSRRDYFDHRSPEGTEVADRLLAGGVTWHGLAGENIALTAAGPEVVFDLWVDSPPHRANIEECAFTHHGLGMYRDRWTQVLVERPGR